MIWLYTLFLLFIVAMLALDLGLFHRHAHVVSIREALLWSGVWIALALAFSGFIYVGYEHQWFGLGTTIDVVTGSANGGRDAFFKYLSGYVIEKSLSVDNIFVFAMLFSSFAVPATYQHRVLFWGIFGALVMRGVMIAVGAEVIALYHWVLYVFGVFLILTGIKMLFIREAHDLREGLIVRFLSRILSVAKEAPQGSFITRVNGRLVLTNLGLVLVIVEVSDLIFAVDSIPAIFAITADPFLVFTSNVFAILGLRSLYFALAGMLGIFRYLKPALAIVLVIVGLKMLFAESLKELLGPNMSLWVLVSIVGILAGSIVASLVFHGRVEHKP